MRSAVLLLVALAGLVAVASAGTAQLPTSLSEGVYQSEFTSYVKAHRKTYATDEFFGRFAVFKANLDKIRRHNTEAAQGKHTFSMAVNEFADMTHSEFVTRFTGYAGVQAEENLLMSDFAAPHLNVTAPMASVDWRQRNAVSGVKNQGSCGSCWAFSTVGATEGAYAVKTGRLASLSPQQLVDCSKANSACNGGLMTRAMQWIIDNKGITTDASYPYTGKAGACRSGMSKAATLSRFVNVGSGSESGLMSALNLGPVSVALQASSQAFQFYKNGVLSDSSCGNKLDHGVLAVGYGTENGRDYWIVKNSWGTGWGEGGYIRILRGKNLCGVASQATYAVV